MATIDTERTGMTTVEEALQAFKTLNGSLEGFDGWEAGFLYGVAFFSYEADLFTIEVADEESGVQIKCITNDESNDIEIGDRTEIDLGRLGIPSRVSKQALFFVSQMS